MDTAEHQTSDKTDTVHIAHIAHLTSDRIWELIILPTESCNLSCTYCYEKHTPYTMGRETIEAIKKLIHGRIAELEQLSINWFGGEPLLAARCVMDISEYVCTLAQKYQGLTYRGSMTTNAYLLSRSLYDELTSLGIADYQITLDGPREMHDKSRVTVSGKGTYDRIWNNLLDIRDSPQQVQINVRIHISPSSISQIDRLLDDLRCELLPDNRFKFHFKALQRLGGESDAIEVFSVEAEKQFIERCKERLHGNVVDSVETAPYVCYASRPNSLMIYPNGDIGKCTVALYDDKNKIGVLNDDGRVSIDVNLLRQWMRGFTPVDASVLRCPLKNFPL